MVSFLRGSSKYSDSFYWCEVFGLIFIGMLMGSEWKMLVQPVSRFA